MSITSDLKRAMNGTYSGVNRLLVINVIVFLLANIIVNLLGMNGLQDEALTFMEWVSLSGNPLEAGLHFWTLISYSFVHFDFFHVLGNMLLLYFLGRMFTDHLGGQRLVGTYFLGGIAGGVLYVITSMFMHNGDQFQLFGASAAVMAIVVGVASYTPDSMIFPFGFGLKLKWFALISFLLSTVLELATNTGGKVAHIGGALLGFVYGSQLRMGKWPLEGFMRLFSRNRLALRRTKMRVEHVQRRMSDHDYNATKAAIRRRIDEILDKISRSGYDSLSREERDFLQKNHDKT